MTLKQVIESRKRFKRKNWDGYINADKLGTQIGIAEVLADDWEIEEDAITITRSQFEQALNMHNFYGTNGASHLRITYEAANNLFELLMSLVTESK